VFYTYMAQLQTSLRHRAAAGSQPAAVPGS
jgi:hypothetical protein